MTAPFHSAALDSSLLLGLLKREPGTEPVAQILPGAAVSSVIWAEALGVCYRQRLDDQALFGLLRLGLTIVPFSQEQAEIAAGLHLNVGRLGLSLADCSCLAVAIDMQLAVYTADTVWEDLGQGVDVRVIR